MTSRKFRTVQITQETDLYDSCKSEISSISDDLQNSNREPRNEDDNASNGSSNKDDFDLEDLQKVKYDILTLSFADAKVSGEYICQLLALHNLNLINFHYFRPVCFLQSQSAIILVNSAIFGDSKLCKHYSY